MRGRRPSDRSIPCCPHCHKCCRRYLETVAGLRILYGDLFFGFELFSVAVFTVEYVIRAWVCVEERTDSQAAPWTARIKYVFTPYALIDLAAVLPFYLSFLCRS